MAIDRQRLVSRHNPVLHSPDPRSPLSVGNGEFAFTVDATGLQTIRAAYGVRVPLCTQAQWGWHSFPLAADEPPLRLEPYDAGGRTIGYPTSPAGQEEAFHRLRRNPHRLNLGAIGFHLPGAPDPTSDPRRIEAVRQELVLWEGIIASAWRFDAIPVTVATCCHPSRDAVSVRVESPLCADSRLAVEIAFPYGSPEIHASDWASPGAHHSLMHRAGPRTFDIERTLDATRYLCRVHLGDGVELHREDTHRFLAVAAPGGRHLSLVVEFLREQGGGAPPASEPLDARAVEDASRLHWARFWQEGGCVELAGSRDPRAPELERRVVLSQYLSAIQCAGTLPPQETGLSCNSWYGKFHLEMHYWHAAHFPLWGRSGLLERSLGWYGSIRDSARRRAREQGFDGARWPKMSGPEGGESPSAINPLIIWQQPHPIMFAELVYRARPGRETLERHADLVCETAEFMASFAREEEGGGRFVLGPPIVPAQENHDPRAVLNPGFELAYWDYGLRTALAWRHRLGLAPVPRWEKVLDGLADLPMAEGRYVSYEGCPETWSDHAVDHPSMLYALGVLPGTNVDRAVMGRTLDAVLSHWRFSEAWGWDFPAIAMSCARLGRPGDAIDALLMETPKNTYLSNGHNAQGERNDLPLYLPGNGGLLIAVAVMAAGWDGVSEETRAVATTGGAAARGAAARETAPGFPADGSWRVTCEGLLPVP